jgi:hypothetical protein
MILRLFPGVFCLPLALLCGLVVFLVLLGDLGRRAGAAWLVR